MRIALFGKHIPPDQLKFLQLLIDDLTSKQSVLVIFAPFYEKIKNQISLPKTLILFSNHQELAENAEFLISIGGDGTILDAVPFVRGSEIPILGINFGRLGFLSSVSKDEITKAVSSIIRKKFILDRRSMISLEEPVGLSGDLNFALNDLTISRNNSSSLISVRVYINDVFLNSYWGDGLIVSTPTGSTAYSLSVGGPIMTPGSQNFIIAPIASHNLTVRPIVIPDSSTIKITFGGREEQFLLSLDSRQYVVDRDTELVIRRSDLFVNLVQLENKDFFTTIRDKLLWGKDPRN